MSLSVANNKKRFEIMSPLGKRIIRNRDSANRLMELIKEERNKKNNKGSNLIRRVGY